MTIEDKSDLDGPEVIAVKSKTHADWVSLDNICKLIDELKN